MFGMAINTPYISRHKVLISRIPYVFPRKKNRRLDLNKAPITCPYVDLHNIYWTLVIHF